MDLRGWRGNKEEEEELRALVVASCLAFLKEVGEKRGQQVAVIAGAAGS